MLGKRSLPKPEAGLCSTESVTNQLPVPSRTNTRRLCRPMEIICFTLPHRPEFNGRSSC
jgi:hypothetical protein